MNNQLNNLKEEYLGQEIPKELKGLVESSIKKAKKENRSQHYFRFTSGVLSAAAAFVLIVNISPDVAYAMENIPFVGSITKAVTFRNYSKTDQNMNIQMTIPHIDGIENSQLEEQLNGHIEQYTAQIQQAYEKEVAETSGLPFGAYDTDYQILTDSSRYFSMRIDTTVTKGSAAQFSNFFTIDKQTGEILSLSDLFKDKTDYLDLISRDILKQMAHQIQTDDNISYFIGDGWSDDETFKQIKPDQNFYITTDGHLVIAFDEYEAAPGYMGMPEFTISDDIYMPR